MADLIERDALESKIRENYMRIRFFDPSVNVILHLIRYAPAVNRWIPVEDALPDDRKCVLVTDGEDIEITYFDGSDWEMRDQYGNHYELYGAITHWMPLPEPPEKE